MSEENVRHFLEFIVRVQEQENGKFYQSKFNNIFGPAFLTFAGSVILITEKLYILASIHIAVVLCLWIWYFTLKQKTLKRCLWNGLLFLEITFLFSASLLIQTKADWKFVLGVVIGYVLTAVAHYLILRRQINRNFFENRGKANKMSWPHFAIIGVCSLLGYIMAPLLSLVASEDQILHILLWLCLFLSMIFIWMIVYNFMGIYYLIKYPQND